MGLSNTEVAGRLDEVANLLEEQQAHSYRVHAWRAGAEVIRHLPQRVADVLRAEGLDGLDRLPSIGPVLARAVRELAETGTLSLLERLRGEHENVAAIPSAPRVETLANRLRPRHLPHDEQAEPTVAELLGVDREYRRLASRDELPRIAPHRFNPGNERWLPIFHTTRNGRHYTALYSNTATAHRVGRTHDWVVIYYDGSHGEHQCTVITAPKGPLERHRIVRGRERECIDHYQHHAAEPTARVPGVSSRPGARHDMVNPSSTAAMHG